MRNVFRVVDEWLLEVVGEGRKKTEDVMDLVYYQQKKIIQMDE